ncbi:hypothetical protein CMO83_02415 [Candidatus Woesearchaeota archaeon]|jgi:hypothetical protein|nr:hypothetical protein [Candidatus Woesearchaeota archaeon]MDP6648287.1 LOG family protein [Candidatus Woesearchaeota archaeon]|tara:strand:- start:39715 stop:40359 length:645 start_codon:yes stop_codon:yes gene_type:complete
MKPKSRSAVIKKHFRVTIFGSARIKKGDPRYKLIYSLAKKIAAEGIDIVTGGGPGLMDAASRGHHAGRGKNYVNTIGLTIHLPKEQKQSYHLDIKKDFSRFSRRLDNFMSLSNVVVVAPGGIGTLLEFLYTLQLMQVGFTCDIPIILMGGAWKDLVRWIKNDPMKKGFLDKNDLDPVFIVNNSTDAMKIIRKARKEYQNKNKNICLNIRKYKIK